jgi:hypothetical protein
MASSPAEASFATHKILFCCPVDDGGGAIRGSANSTPTMSPALLVTNGHPLYGGENPSRAHVGSGFEDGLKAHGASDRPFDADGGDEPVAVAGVTGAVTGGVALR